jgi:thioredoxin-like negative regulator of GroEL
MRFHVMGLPTLILFVAGEPVARLQGLQTKRRIVEAVEAHLSAR